MKKSSLRGRAQIEGNQTDALNAPSNPVEELAAPPVPQGDRLSESSGHLMQINSPMPW
jgi:hypothetical protein